MKPVVGINGFGRIGRLAFRTGFERGAVEFGAINDPFLTPEYVAYLLRFDTMHGRFQGDISFDDHSVTVCGRKIPVYCESTPESIPWSQAGVQYVVESTGVFLTAEKAQGHLRAGAQKVVLSAPPKDDVPMFVMGVNHGQYRTDMDIVSNASCTTNCLAPLAKVLDESFGIESGLMTTVHAITMPQLTEQMVKATRAAAIHDALRWTSGHNFNSWRNPFTTNKLRYIGIAEDQIEDIRARWGKYLHQQKDGVRASEIEARWYNEDKEGLMKFYHFLDAQSKRSIQQDTVGATPYLTSASDLSPIFKILLQFRDFTQRALHTVIMRGAHEISVNDLDIGMAMIYSGIGNGMMYALGNQARAWSRWPDDERKRREYLRKVNDPERIIEAGIIRSNLVSGLTWSATDVYEAVTGRQSTNFYTDRSGSFFTRDIGEAGGDFLESVPAARVLQGVYSAGRIGITAALPNHSVSTKDVNNLFAALPFGNFIPLLWVQELIKDLVR